MADFRLWPVVSAVQQVLLIGSKRGGSTPPAYKAMGSPAASTGGLTVNWPGTESTGDLAILTVSADAAVSTPSGWTLIDTESDGAGTTLSVFWKRVTTPESSVSVSDVGVIQLANILVFSGVISSGSPIATYEKSSLAASSTVTWPSVSTVETAVFMFYAATKAAGFPFLSSYASTSGAVTSIVERLDTGASSGPGHALGIATASFGGGGPSGTVTAANGNPSQTMAVMSIAILG